VSLNGVNWWGVAFYIVVAFIIVIAIAYFVWPQGIIHTTLASGFAFITQNLPKIDFNGITTWIKENAAVAGVMATLGTTAVGYVIKNYQTNQVNKVLDNKILELEKDNLSLINKSSQVTELQKQLDVLNADTTALDLQKRISSFSDERLQMEAQLRSLQNQNQELMNMLAKTPVKIVEVVK
jgi:hypothetical protein